MNKDKEKIFSSSGCLSLEVILKYVQERSTLKERHQVERHLLECALCQDAVEGYEMMAEKENVAGVISRIDRHYESKKTERFEIRRIAAGIAVVIMFGTGLYYVNTISDPASQQVSQEQQAPSGPADIENTRKTHRGDQDGKLALEEKKEEKATIENGVREPAPDAAGKGAVEKQVKPSGKNSYSQSGSGVSNFWFYATIPEGERQSKSLAMDTHNLKDQIDHTSRQPIAVIAPETKTHQWTQSNEAMETVSVEEESSVIKSNSIPDAKRSKAKAKSLSSPAPVTIDSGAPSGQTEKEDLSSLQEGVRQYHQKNYKEASKIFEEFLKSDSANEQARYYNGLSYFEMNDWGRAVKNLDHIKAGADYFEEAQWKKALALLKNGDKAAAENILEEIAGRPGPNRQNAAEVLKTID